MAHPAGVDAEVLSSPPARVTIAPFRLWPGGCERVVVAMNRRRHSAAVVARVAWRASMAR